jgi:hypothetical protein
VDVANIIELGYSVLNTYKVLGSTKMYDIVRSIAIVEITIRFISILMSKIVESAGNVMVLVSFMLKVGRS